MQAAICGYVATGEPSFLEQYRAARINLPSHLTAAQELSARVDTALVPQLEELRQIIDAHLQQKIEANNRRPRYSLTGRAMGYRMAKA